MSWKEIIGLTIWLSGMAYSALSIGIPEIRMNWKGSDVRLGPISSFGFAWFFWGLPLLFLAGWLLGIESQTLAMFIFFLVFMASCGVGYFMDISEKRKA